MNQSQGHILVVDDDQQRLITLVHNLEQQGYAISLAENGKQALEMIQVLAYDLILLDILMPVMDGYQVLEYMKSSDTLRDIPVIVISAVDEMDSIIRCIRMGAEDYLPKTLDPVFLKARVDACLEKKYFRDQEIEYLRQVDRLTEAAAALENDSFDPDSLEDVASRTDALGQLTRVFQRMAREFYVRERRLK